MKPLLSLIRFVSLMWYTSAIYSFYLFLDDDSGKIVSDDGRKVLDGCDTKRYIVDELIQKSSRK